MPPRPLIGIVCATLVFWLSNTTITQAANEIMSIQMIEFSEADQKLTANIDNTSLKQVAQALTSQLSITITLMGFEGNTQLSTVFANLPLEQGIERLLHGQDYALLYSHTNPPRLKEIFVLPRPGMTTHSTSKNTRIVMHPIDNDLELSEVQSQIDSDDLEHQRLESVDLKDKVKELTEVFNESQEKDISLLNEAFNDQDPVIRELATALLEDMAFSTP